MPWSGADCKDLYLMPNEPLPEQIKRWGNDTRKIYADYYIDDKNMTIAQVESTMNQIKEIMEEIKE